MSASGLVFKLCKQLMETNNITDPIIWQWVSPRSCSRRERCGLANIIEPQAEYHPPDSSPKLTAAIVDVDTTGTNSDRDKIIELGVCLFEYDSQSGRVYKVLGSSEWFESPRFSIPPEITKITGITNTMVAGHRIGAIAEFW
jgi:DNA polymerase III epsilon subunit-like protein